eukprot:Sspe_Gene.100437::Locus_75153_Transcript_1_1_Confidence_1.000_Length_856::g.100437::m.100437
MARAKAVRQKASKGNEKEEQSNDTQKKSQGTVRAREEDNEVEEPMPISIYRPHNGQPKAKRKKRRLEWADNLSKPSPLRVIHCYEAPWGRDTSRWWHKEEMEISAAWSLVLPPKNKRMVVVSGGRGPQMLSITFASATLDKPSTTLAGKRADKCKFSKLSIYHQKTDMAEVTERVVRKTPKKKGEKLGEDTGCTMVGCFRSGETHKMGLKLLPGPYLFRNEGQLTLVLRGLLEMCLEVNV